MDNALHSKQWHGREIFLGRNRTKPALSVKNGGGEETKTRRERKERGKGQNDEMRYREGKGG